LLFNKFFSIADKYFSFEDIARQSAEMAIFLRPVFSASRAQHVSDLLPKFALRPHPRVEVW